MKKKIIGLIPVRLKSLRLFEKPLLKLSDYPLFVHVYKRAKLSPCKPTIVVMNLLYQFLLIVANNKVNQKHKKQFYLYQLIQQI